MYVVLAILALVMETPAVHQTCPEFCKSIFSGIADVSLQIKCNCFPRRQFWPRSGHYLEIDDSGIYYEPADIYPVQQISFVENPFYIMFKLDSEISEASKSNKIPTKRTSHNHDYEIQSESRSKQNHRDNTIDRDSDAKLKGHPLYLDLDIADSIAIERTVPKEDRKTKDFDFMEQNLIECIDLHILINARQSDNTNELKIVWGDVKFDKYDNLTDSDIKIEIENKCGLTANVIEQSLEEIRGTLPNKKSEASRAAKNSEEEIINISRIGNYDNNSIHETSTTSRVKLTVPSDYTKLNLSTTTGHSDVGNATIKNSIETSQESTTQSNLNVHEVPTANSTMKKLSTRSTFSTETSNSNSEFTLEINDQQRNDQLSTDSLTSNLIVDDTTEASSDINEDNENYTTQVPYQVDSNYHIFSSVTDTITIDDYDEATTIGNTELPFFRTHARENTEENKHNFTHHNPQNKSVKTKTEEHFIEKPSTRESVILNELNKQNDYNNNSKVFLTIFNNRSINNEINSNSNSGSIEHETNNITTESGLRSEHHISKDKDISATEVKRENRNENKITELKIPQIETIEFENGTAVSKISNETNQLPNNEGQTRELDTISEETRILSNDSDAKLDNTTIYNANTSEISGSLYFLFDKQNIPARFVQKSDGKLHIGIDGNSLCDILNFSENNSTLLSLICNDVRSNNT